MIVTSSDPILNTKRCGPPLCPAAGTANTRHHAPSSTVVSNRPRPFIIDTAPVGVSDSCDSGSLTHLGSLPSPGLGLRFSNTSHSHPSTRHFPQGAWSFSSWPHVHIPASSHSGNWGNRLKNRVSCSD